MYDSLNSVVQGFNTNKYIYGFLMILLNMGARYIELDLVNTHKQFLSSKLLRRILIFTISFIATRDLMASLIITASFIIIVLNLFNSESEYCIIPKTYINLDTNNDGKVSKEEELEHAYKILKKYGEDKSI